HQDLVDQLQQFDVFGAAIARTLQQPDRTRESRLHHLQRIADQEGAQCAAHDDDHLERVPEQQQAAAACHEATQHTAEYHQCSDDCDHLSSAAGESIQV